MQSPEMPHPGPEPQAPKSAPRVYGVFAWQALTGEPGVAVAVVSLEGRVMWANETSSELFCQCPPAEAVGKTLHEIAPAEWADERLALFQQVARTGQPVLLRSIWRGEQIQSTFRCIEAEDGAPDHVMVITRKGEFEPEPEGDGPGSGYQIVESKLMDLGDLEPLSPRELEVLALLGEGMTIREIAETLTRSPKTIERHRDSIGRKLDKHNRVELARVAAQAGLEVDDARLQRIKRGG